MEHVDSHCTPNCMHWSPEFPFLWMEQHQLWKTRLRQGRQRLLTITSINTSPNISTSLPPLPILATRSRISRPHVTCGCSKSRHYDQKHSIPAQCRGPTHLHKAHREQWSESAPCRGQTTLPAHGPMTWQSPEDGLDNFWLVLQYDYYVVAPGVILTNPADYNSCKVHKHPAWHVVIEDNEAQ